MVLGQGGQQEVLGDLQRSGHDVQTGPGVKGCGTQYPDGALLAGQVLQASGGAVSVQLLQIVTIVVESA